MKTYLLLILWALFSNINAQVDQWTFIGITVFTEIPTSCAKEAEYGAVLIKRNQNYSKNKTLLEEAVKSHYNGFIGYKYYSFKTTDSAVGVIAQIHNKCDKLLKTETDWIGYEVRGAKDAVTATDEIKRYVSSTTGIQTYSILQTFDLNSAVKNAVNEVVILKGMGFSTW